MSFPLQLSEKEIEEDFIKLVGHLPPNKSKTFTSKVQTKLNIVFPGSQLTTHSQSSYDVPEPSKEDEDEDHKDTYGK
ncbi:hypothetical protein RJT34_07280 [Clitoria ternatea]|uniref:Uncharacterized protein n=1 Tax=Clitoria ternatea TaxID=43366 RepID=A0AAN9K3A6_CLITE